MIDKKLPRAVIIEFKVSDNEDLEKTALKALEQIEEKRYEVDLRERVSNIVKAGIALKGKSGRCKIV
ncbi:MAG: PD-(D/E)XK nuclease domain-containing protein [Thermovenabulum sp.]|uniref:PD-(D/E)XK nuclease domain-containing protein n=1 Tax=Thermovenabulum sp. TaxID=3100335 RepID=UPI003C7D8158